MREGQARDELTSATYHGKGQLVPYLDAMATSLSGGVTGLVFVVGLLGVDDKKGSTEATTQGRIVLVVAVAAVAMQAQRLLLACLVSRTR